MTPDEINHSVTKLLNQASGRTTLTTSALLSLLLCNFAMAESHSEHTEHAALELNNDGIVLLSQ